MSGVCAVIPAHNRVGELTRALRSVAAQTVRCDEIVVVDDGSSADLAPALAAVRGIPVRRNRHTEQRRAAAARNTGARRLVRVAGLPRLRRRVVPHKLEVQLPQTRASGLDASCTGFEFVRKGRRSRRHMHPERAARRRMLAGADLAPGSTLVVARAVPCRGWIDEGLRRLEDWDWLLRWTTEQEALLIDHPLALVHVGIAPDAAVVLKSLDRTAVTTRGSSWRDQWVLRMTLRLERAAVQVRGGSRTRAAATVLPAVLGYPPHLRRVLARLRG